MSDREAEASTESAMQWGSVSEFFAMGGKGLYVWGSYAVTVLVLAIEVVILRRGRTPDLGRGRTRADGNANG